MAYPRNLGGERYWKIIMSRLYQKLKCQTFAFLTLLKKENF